MTISAAYFQNEIALAAKTSNNHNYANTKSELTLLATALGTDPTIYDTTIQAAPGNSGIRRSQRTPIGSIASI